MKAPAMETGDGGDNENRGKLFTVTCLLKNLNLLSADFPEYLGERRRAYIKLVQKENKLASCSCDPR